MSADSNTYKNDFILNMSNGTTTSNYIKTFNAENDVKKYLKDIKLKKRFFGGIDEEFMFLMLQDINNIYLNHIQILQKQLRIERNHAYELARELGEETALIEKIQKEIGRLHDSKQKSSEPTLPQLKQKEKAVCEGESDKAMRCYYEAQAQIDKDINFHTQKLNELNENLIDMFTSFNKEYMKLQELLGCRDPERNNPGNTTWEDVK